VVLGSFPGVASLQAQQYYGHPRNHFWPILSAIWGIELSALTYAPRLQAMLDRGVGLWDVYASCQRIGSLDSSILLDSEVANDIPSLLDVHPGIAAIALNGAKAHQVFQRRIAPAIDPHRLCGLAVLALPSTSPANASISRQHKLARWREIERWAPPLR
jgi:hypoxanthine-DNA glycosylase